ncbi:hypothetical protein ABZ078_23555 [Streptomyces sp. NPDC006385]
MVRADLEGAFFHEVSGVAPPPLVMPSAGQPTYAAIQRVVVR